MRKRRAVIWFIEGGWTKQHVAIGIDASFTLCGIVRSTRRIGRDEMYPPISEHRQCKKCLSALKRHFGASDIAEVFINE